MIQTPLPARYRILEEVGQGGMAVVYRAQDETLRREVAIKVLHPHLLAEGESKARLQREAQAVAKLQHENILQVFDYSGGDSPSSYIVSEFIDGLTLRQFLANRKTPLPEVAALVVLEVGGALCHAHSLGIIHRDVKPENVMVRKDGLLKLMDFGVAQVLDLERMTVTGQLLGSPAYMAPEIFEGKPLDVRTDVFSLGVMLYQLATGALPFSGRNPHEVLRRIAEGRFTDPRTANRFVSDRLARIISRALAKKPDDRYPTVAAMLEDLRAYAADAGLSNPREELGRYFGDPEAHEREIAPRVVSALVATGKREQARKSLARALEAWNRALALDPKNPAVERELSRLAGRRRVRNAAVAMGGTALLAGLIWGAFEMAREDLPVAVAVAVKARVTQKQGDPVKPAPAPPASTKAKKPKERLAAQSHRSPGSKPASKTFSLRTTPPGVQVFVDGEPPFLYGPGKTSVTLAMDRKHKVVFRNECCVDKELEVDPAWPNQFPNDLILARLAPKVGTLTVTLRPNRQDATLAIWDSDRPIPARFGEETLISFDAAGDLQKSLLVSVSVGDKVVKQEEVSLRAGEKKPHLMTLD